MPILANAPTSLPMRVRNWLRLRMRRLSYRARGMQMLLSLTVENSFLFSLLLIVPTAVATLGITFAVDRDISFAGRVVAIAVSIGLPLSAVFYVYLGNISRTRRADLAIRARRHDDRAVIVYVCELATGLLNFVNAPDSPQKSVKSRTDRDLALSFLRVRSIYLRLVMDQAALHFRVTREALEEAMGVPAKVLENQLTSRLLLHYDLAHGSNTSLQDEAERMDKAFLGLSAHLQQLVEMAGDFARILRTIVKQPSTGAAMTEAVSILRAHLGEDTCEIAASLIGLRRGISLTDLIGYPALRDEIECKRDAVNQYLGKLRELQSAASEGAVSEAVALLTNNYDYLPENAVVFTVGYSRMVARALSLAGSMRKDFTVGIIVPSVASEWEWDKVVFADEDRMMAAEIAAKDTLKNRIFRVDPAGLSDLSLDWATAVLVSGAEAITPEGVLLHPRGRLTLHRQLEHYLRSTGTVRRSGYRYAIAESFKLIQPTRREITTRLLASIGPDEYDVLITDAGIYEGNSRRRLDEKIMTAWRKRVRQKLPNSDLTLLS